MTIATSLGFPRIGRNRALKTALESFWAGSITETELQAQAAGLRRAHWQAQVDAGIGTPPSNDFSLYDHVLDTACMLGAIAPNHGWDGGAVNLATYFALARGTQTGNAGGCAHGAQALEMTKWFDTNYHYLVPRLRADQRFTLTANRPLDAVREARAAGFETRPVLLGPVSFLLLAKMADGGDRLALLDRLLPLYEAILAELRASGVDWVQIDEPVLALGLQADALNAFPRAYTALARVAPKLLLTSYFGPYAENLYTALALPIAGLHLDLTRGASDFLPALEAAPTRLWLSLGVVDGRNVWRNDLAASLKTLRTAAAKRGTDQLMVAPSCSLLHVPVDLEAEEGASRSGLSAELKTWLAFAVQKLQEITVLATGLDQGDEAIAQALALSNAVRRLRQNAPGVHDPAVAARLAAVEPAMEQRASRYGRREAEQQKRLNLPLLPTTSIGSLPQTREVRAARAAFTAGRLAEAEYETELQGWIRDAVRWQEAAGLDMLVHGEFERNDMVKYFGEQLAGFAFTARGWVQSYGSRCVAPPIIWGDVSRPQPMTVRWARFAQSLTEKPVKGMLTGPVTMLQWSFVRDDISRETVCRQIALALRDEVQDLEAAGIAAIQIDEPAIREGLPLRERNWPAYLHWAVSCFRLASAGVGNQTQIHTHMCYSEFHDIIGAIAGMDADVISIETARSAMELLDAFAAPGAAYPNAIGPGIWDIHSPRVPSTEEMVSLLRLARARLRPGQIWVNPDCGLKTRNWTEVRLAIANMVRAAALFRAELEKTQPA